MKQVQSSSGQALTMLLVFVAAGVIITVAAVTMAIVNYVSAGKATQGEYAYFLAEAGAENALIRLLRDPTYSGETLSIDGGTASVSVSGVLPNKAIISEGISGTLRRKVRVDVIINNTLSIQSWREEL